MELKLASVLQPVAYRVHQS